MRRTLGALHALLALGAMLGLTATARAETLTEAWVRAYLDNPALAAQRARLKPETPVPGTAVPGTTAAPPPVLGAGVVAAISTVVIITAIIRHLSTG